METFTEPGEFVTNTRYSQDRHDALAALDLSSIDRPIVDIVAGFSTLPHSFTLQSCYGHFVCAPRAGIPYTLEPIPRGHSGPLRYRIAYIAFCIENSRRGWALREAFAQIPRGCTGLYPVRVCGLVPGTLDQFVRSSGEEPVAPTNWRMRSSWSLAQAIRGPQIAARPLLRRA